MKQFVKGLDKDGQCFQYLKKKFPKLSIAKLKEGIFTGPDIRKLINDPDFVNTMTNVEREAWLSFKNVIENFLGNEKTPNYTEIVSDMMQNYKELGCLMSLKMHYLFSHLDYFPQNLGDFSEEQGERFHQDIKNKEKHYQGRWDVHMMADYCWSLKRSDSVLYSNKRKPLRRLFGEKQVKFHKEREN